MIRIIGNEKQRALAWARPRWPGVNLDSEEWGRFAALILEKDGDIAATVFYKNYIPKNSIEVHLAAVSGGRWLTRPFLRAAFQYPFEQLGLRRITTLVAADNIRAVQFDEHIGWVREGVIRQGWAPDVDLLVYGMLKSECRFLGEKGEPRKKHGRDTGRSDSDRQRPNGLE